MKDKLQEILKTICFLLVFVIAFYFVDQTLKIKNYDGILPIENMYAVPEDTIDVLILGSSHVGANIDPATMWKLEGIAAYTCWGSIQPVWSTYYYLKECLKTQSPKLVIMDVYVTTKQNEYTDYERILKNVLGMRPSSDKWEAIRVSSSESYHTNIALGFPTYHYRYSDLKAEDFSYYFWQKDPSLQHLVTTDSVAKYDFIDTSSITECEPLSPKVEEYFFKIIDLCREKGIPLLLVESPYTVDEREQKCFNTVDQIAKENDLPFLNFNNFYSDIGIDPHQDYCDGHHFNNGGIKKYTTYLTEYIASHYDLPDRRQDASHFWTQQAQISDEHLVYALDQQFQGDGQNYIDTGLFLCKDPYASYTVLTKFDTTVACDSMAIYLSCFDENPGQYRGLLIRKEDDGKLHIIFSIRYGTVFDIKHDEMTVGVVKNELHYQIYIDGDLVSEFDLDPLEPYDGPLLLGCEEDAEGTPMRQSDVRIMDVQVYDVALDAAQVCNWLPHQLPAPQE